MAQDERGELPGRVSAVQRWLTRAGGLFTASLGALFALAVFSIPLRMGTRPGVLGGVVTVLLVVLLGAPGLAFMVWGWWAGQGRLETGYPEVPVTLATLCPGCGLHGSEARAGVWSCPGCGVVVGPATYGKWLPTTPIHLPSLLFMLVGVPWLAALLIAVLVWAFRQLSEASTIRELVTVGVGVLLCVIAAPWGIHRLIRSWWQKWRGRGVFVCTFERTSPDDRVPRRLRSRAQVDPTGTLVSAEGTSSWSTASRPPVKLSSIEPALADSLRLLARLEGGWLDVITERTVRWQCRSGVVSAATSDYRQAPALSPWTTTEQCDVQVVPSESLPPDDESLDELLDEDDDETRLDDVVERLRSDRGLCASLEREVATSDRARELTAAAVDRRASELAAMMG